MSWQTDTIAIGSPILSFSIGYLMYKRSVQVDKATEKSGIVTESRAGVQQIIDAQTRLNEQLQRYLDQSQEDSIGWRDKYFEERTHLQECFKEGSKLRQQLNRMYRKYGDNGNSGEIPITKDPS